MRHGAKSRLVALAIAIACGGFLLKAVFAAQASPFAEGNAQYQAGNFKAAVKSYREIVDAGGASATVYYNLGNASFRAGERGRALIYYERALSGAPRDADLRWNIAVLRSTLADRIEAPDDNFVAAKVKRALGLVSIDEISGVFAWALAALAFLALIDFVLSAAKPFTGPVRGIVFALLVLTAAAFALKWWDVKDPRVVVLEREVYARYGPSDKETKAFLLHEGAEAKVADETQDWIYVVLKNKNSGWIPKDSCEVI